MEITTQEAKEMTPREIEARSIRTGDQLTPNGSTVIGSEYDSARNAYRITYTTKTNPGTITIPANDLVVIWK